MNKKGCVFYLAILSAAFAQTPPPAVESAPPPKNWSHESEASAVVVGGNSKSQTFSGKQTTGYAFGINKLILDGHYLLGKSNGVKSAENWNAGLRYEVSLSPKLALYAGEGVASDRFQDIDYQSDSDVGAKYTWWKSDDKDYYLSELGYRFTYYRYVPGTDPQIRRSHFARIYNEVATSINDKVYGKFWVELLPDLGNLKEKFVVNFEPSLNVVLTKYFSLKTGFLGKYDTKPASADLVKFDYTYTFGLIAKY